MPPPRSSTPRKPMREVALPELDSWFRSAMLPRPIARSVSTTPNSVTEDCADTAPTRQKDYKSAMWEAARGALRIHIGAEQKLKHKEEALRQKRELEIGGRPPISVGWFDSGAPALPLRCGSGAGATVPTGGSRPAVRLICRGGTAGARRQWLRLRKWLRRVFPVQSSSLASASRISLLTRVRAGFAPIWTSTAWVRGPR